MICVAIPSHLRLLPTFLTNILFLCSGMDAQVSYAFHSERKLHPEKFKNQLVNQVLLLYFCN